MPYQTPDAPITTRLAHFTISVWDDPAWTSLLKGALAGLTREHSWEKSGEVETWDAAEDFARFLLGIRRTAQLLVGVYIQSFVPLDEAYFLPCYGQVEAMADWPELAAVWSPLLLNYPEPGQMFIPNMQGRTLVGDGVDSSGFNWVYLSQGGERQHTLTANEMPAHTHGESIAVPTIINGGLEAPASAATNATGVTGSAGGGLPHNNMPPHGVGKVYVLARAL